MAKISKTGDTTNIGDRVRVEPTLSGTEWKVLRSDPDDSDDRADDHLWTSVSSHAEEAEALDAGKALAEDL